MVGNRFLLHALNKKFLFDPVSISVSHKTGQVDGRLLVNNVKSEQSTRIVSTGMCVAWENRSTSDILLLSIVHCVLRLRLTDCWNAPCTALAGGMLMAAPAVEGIDLFKIAGRSISGWIPSYKPGHPGHVQQPFCSQLEARLFDKWEVVHRRGGDGG